MFTNDIFQNEKKRKKKSKPQIIFIDFKTSSFLQDVFIKVNHSGNQDIGEGMFDGLMQVMVCGVSEIVDPYRYHIDIHVYFSLIRKNDHLTIIGFRMISYHVSQIYFISLTDLYL